MKSERSLTPVCLQLRLFDMHQPESEPHVLTGHETGKAIKVVRYLPGNDGKLFLSAGDDKTLRLWDVRTLSQVSQLTFSGTVNSVELSKDEKTLTIAAGTEVRAAAARSLHGHHHQRAAGGGAAATCPATTAHTARKHGLLAARATGFLLGCEQLPVPQALLPAGGRGQRLRRQQRDTAP